MNRCLLLVLCIVWTPWAWAWGSVGHRLTGLIAESQLSPAARQQVQQLLGEESLSVAATYMDTQRQLLTQRWPEADRWHYENRAVCGAPPACADGHCVTAQIERFRKLLTDTSNSRSERALALRLLVHMLGDLHQPLHLADHRDRGGNNTWVRLHTGGQRYRLHEVFDSVLLKQVQGRRGVQRFAADLQQQYREQFASWRRGTVPQWAAQTHQLARTHGYAQLSGFACNASNTNTVTLTDGYVGAASAYLPEQLAKAGVRIAVVLNQTLR